jgi:uncharacterized protein (DUF305 family)
MRMESRKTGTAALAAVLLLVSVSQAHPPHQHEISPPEGTPSAESFTSLMMQATERTHKDMNINIVPTGDPDRDFAAMMIPHHQGAIDMAKVELQFGKDPVLRRLAQGIIVEQLQEIEVMQRELRQLSAASKER